MSFTKKNLISLILLFLIGGYMYICNYFMPLFADDYGYTYIFHTNSKVSSLYDVIESQIDHYFTWGGRTVAHIFVQIFLFVGKDIFNYFNAAVFCLLILLIYWVYKGQQPSLKIKPYPIILIFSFVWSCTKAFGETTLWLTGACNYLWTTCLVLAYLLPYSVYYKRGSLFNKNNNFFNLFIFLLGIVAGWTNENSIATVILLNLAFCIYLYLNKSLENWMIVGFIGLVIGFSAMILAPGNFIRREIFVSDPDYSLLKNLIGVLRLTWRAVLKQLPMWIILVAFFRNIKFVNLKYPKETAFIISFASASLFSALVMLASPAYASRVMFFSSIFLVVATLACLDLQRQHNVNAFSKLNKIIVLVTVCITLATMPLTLTKYHTLKRESDQRIEIIIQEKNNGNLNIVVPKFSVEDRSVLEHIFVRDISSKDINYWTNASVANFYGLESIRSAE